MANFSANITLSLDEQCTNINYYETTRRNLGWHWFTAYAIFNIVILELGAVGNMCVIVVHLKQMKKLGKHHVLVVMMCCGDFLYCSIFQPMTYLNIGFGMIWPFNTYAYCAMNGIFIVILCHVSVGSHLPIAINRLVAVFWPVWYKKSYKHSFTVFLVGLMYIPSIITDGIGYSGYGKYLGRLPPFCYCCDIPKTDQAWWESFKNSVQFYIPAVLCVAIYAAIYLKIRGMHKGQQMLSNETKSINEKKLASTRVSFLALLGDISVYIPVYVFFTVAGNLGTFAVMTSDKVHIFFMAILLQNLGSILSPVIYMFKDNNVRIALRLKPVGSVQETTTTTASSQSNNRNLGSGKYTY